MKILNKLNCIYQNVKYNSNINLYNPTMQKQDKESLPQQQQALTLQQLQQIPTDILIQFMLEASSWARSRIQNKPQLQSIQKTSNGSYIFKNILQNNKLIQQINNTLKIDSNSQPKSIVCPNPLLVHLTQLSLNKSIKQSLQSIASYIQQTEQQKSSCMQAILTLLAKLHIQNRGNGDYNNSESLLQYKRVLGSIQCNDRGSANNDGSGTWWHQFMCIYSTLLQDIISQQHTININMDGSISKQMMNKYKNALDQQLINQQIIDYISKPGNTKLQSLKQQLQIQQSFNPQTSTKYLSAFLTHYLSHIANSNTKAAAAYQNFMHFKLLQLLYVAANFDNRYCQVDQQYIGQLAHYPAFMAVMYRVMCDFSNKGANALAVNIYANILTANYLSCPYFQVFVDVYMVLDCYGMHLIKDVWHKFYTLCQLSVNSPKSPEPLLSIPTLLHILLQKVQQHPNHNVPKHCIQSLLQNQTCIEALFLQPSMHDTVYGSLIQILNTGTHYTDCPHFHQDSKIYALTKLFYSRGLACVADRLGKEALGQHVGMLIEGMCKYITFQHCIMAYIQILANIPNSVTLSPKHTNCLIELTNKFLIKLTYRKRYKFLQCILKCLQFNTNIKEMGLQWIIGNVILGLPEQIIQVKYNGKKTKYEQNNGRQGMPWIYAIVLNSYSRQQMLDTYSTILQQYTGTYIQLPHNEQHPKQHICQLKQLSQQLTILHSLLPISISTGQQSSIEPQPLPFLHLLQLSQSLYATHLQYALAICNVALMAKYLGKGMRFQLELLGTGHNGKYKGMEALLNIVTKCQGNSYVTMSDISACIQLVASHIKQSNHEQPSKIYAKFIEYCITKIKQNTSTNSSNSTQFAIRLLILSLAHKQTHTIQYKAIEQCIYDVYQSICKAAQWEENQNQNQNQEKDKECKLGQWKWVLCIAVKFRLRLQVLAFTILCHHHKYALKVVSQPKYINQLVYYCNMYNYQHYQQLLNMITLIFSLPSLTTLGLAQLAQTPSAMLKIVSTILNNLDYGVHKKQINSICRCVTRIALTLNFIPETVQLIQYVISIGANYWGFQRALVFNILNQVNKIDIQAINGDGFRRVLMGFICIEEYRGQDAYILLHQYNTFYAYTHHKLHQQADYDGTAVRFITIQWIKQQLDKLCANQASQDKSNRNKSIQLWIRFFQQVLSICINDSSNQRMFMTGTHKTKIKNCQILPIYPHFLSLHYSQASYSKTVLLLLDSLTQSNLTQIKHYLQTFMLKLIYLQPEEEILAQVSNRLCRQLLAVDGQNSLLKNVSFIVIAGLLLQIKYHQKLFNVLLAFVCSHVAYYRGLSQYFCFKFYKYLLQQQKQQKLSNTQSQLQSLVSNPYIRILYEQFIKDEDAIKLTQKLNSIIEEYKHLVVNWNIYDHLFTLKPTLNNQVVTNDHYLDKLKYLGHLLIKEQKHQDGFMAYRDAWKKLATPTHPTQCQKQITKQNNQNQILKQEQSTSFQRKIDPSLDDIYNFEPILHKKKLTNNLKIFVISSQQIALYGHMARVGQILGISELCIPNMKIVDMEDFYNVSVTAQKWLNITQHKYERIKQNSKQSKQKSTKKQPKKPQKSLKSNQKSQKKAVMQQQQSKWIQVNKNSLIQMINRHKKEGYKIYKIVKQPSCQIQVDGHNHTQLSQFVNNFAKKSLLLIDQLGYLSWDLGLVDGQICFNQFYSLHIEATIFIWEYFKKYTIKQQIS